MVALDKQFDHHRGTKPRSRGRWRNKSWQTGRSLGRRTADILSARRHRDASISLNTSCANEIIYCGYRFDPETQLYYVRNRTYNPVLGRWIQRDPIGYEGGINLYEYVGGKSTGNLDSSGTIVYALIYASIEITAGLGGSISFGYAADDCGSSAQFMTISQWLGANVGIAFANGGVFTGCLRDFIKEGLAGVDLTVSADVGTPIVGVNGTGVIGIGGSGSGVQGGLGTGIKSGASIGLDEIVPLGHPDLKHKCPCKKQECPVNPNQPFPSGYVPNDLIPVGQAYGFW